MKVKYNCKDNDAKLQFHFVDGKIDEVWVQIEGEKTWTVIGYNDLLNGIKKAEQFCKTDVSGSLLTDDIIIQIAYEYANQYYSKDANPIGHESLTEPFIDGFKKAMELISNNR